MLIAARGNPQSLALSDSLECIDLFTAVLDNTRPVLYKRFWNVSILIAHTRYWAYTLSAEPFFCLLGFRMSLHESSKISVEHARLVARI